MSIKEKFQNLASSGLNKLSPSANLFLRYYTGLGSEGLDLKDDYLSKVREATKSADELSGRFDKEFIKLLNIISNNLHFSDILVLKEIMLCKPEVISSAPKVA